MLGYDKLFPQRRLFELPLDSPAVAVAPRAISGVGTIPFGTISDSFTRANSTTTIGSPEAGRGPWIVTAATAGSPTMGITSNQAYLVSLPPGGGISLAVVPAFMDGTFRVDISNPTGGGRLVFRFSDPLNYWDIVPVSGFNAVAIAKTVNGVRTQQQVWSGLSVTPYVQAVCSGSSISVYAGSPYTLLGTLTDSFNQTAVYAGFCAVVANVNTFDNFIATTDGAALLARIPTAISGVGSLPSDTIGIGTSTPSAIGGIGSTQTPTLTPVGTPTKINGTGTTFGTAVATDIPVPSQIGGVGTAATPTIAVVGIPSQISGAGTTYAPTDTDTPAITVCSGIGTTQTPTVALAATPAQILGTGITSVPTDSETLTTATIGGIGSLGVPSVTSTSLPGQIAGIGSMFGSSVATDLPTPTRILGTGTVPAALIALIATPGQIVAVGTASTPTTPSASLPSAILALGTLGVPTDVDTPIPVRINGIGTIAALAAVNSSGTITGSGSLAATAAIAGLGSIAATGTTVSTILTLAAIGSVTGAGQVYTPDVSTPSNTQAAPAAISGIGTSAASATATVSLTTSATGTIFTPTVTVDSSSTATPSVIPGSGTVSTTFDSAAFSAVRILATGTVGPPLGLVVARPDPGGIGTVFIPFEGAGTAGINAVGRVHTPTVTTFVGGIAYEPITITIAVLDRGASVDVRKIEPSVSPDDRPVLITPIDRSAIEESREMTIRLSVLDRGSSVAIYEVSKALIPVFS